MAMYVAICTYNVFIHTYMSVYMYQNMYIQRVYTQIHECIHIHKFIHTSIHIYSTASWRCIVQRGQNMYVCVYVCMCVCMHACTYIYRVYICAPSACWPWYSSNRKVSQHFPRQRRLWWCWAPCAWLIQCVAVCCSVLQCVAACWGVAAVGTD